MKILITGSEQHWALERIYAKHLTAFGAEVIIFSSADRLDNYQRKSILNKVLFRAGLSEVVKKINAELIAFAHTIKPDIIWVFKGVEIEPATLKALSHLLLVNYNPDHPFIRTYSSNGGKNIEACLPLYRLNLCYNRELCTQIKKMFGKEVYWLPFGYELAEEEYSACSEEQEKVKVCFAGNPDAIRARLVKEIAQYTAVDVYGHQWNKFISPGNNITTMEAVYGSAFWKILHSYRVQLNIFRLHNTGSHNMRTFEVPAAGGIMLAPDSAEHRFFFEAGKEIFLYTDTTACITQVKNLLSKTFAEAITIRRQARARSTTSHYNYHDRASEVYHVFNTLG